MNTSLLRFTARQGYLQRVIGLSSRRCLTVTAAKLAVSRKHNYETEFTVSVDPVTGEKTFKKPMTMNTELPDDPRPLQRMQGILTFLVFAAGMTAACLGIFNYEKVSSPIMNATMYFLRRSAHSRELLGNRITYDGLFPWISGEVNTMKGIVDCSAQVCGDKGSALMILKAEKNHDDKFKIIQWLLVGENGDIVDLTNDATVDLTF